MKPFWDLYLVFLACVLTGAGTEEVIKGLPDDHRVVDRSEVPDLSLYRCNRDVTADEWTVPPWLQQDGEDTHSTTLSSPRNRTGSRFRFRIVDRDLKCKSRFKLSVPTEEDSATSVKFTHDGFVSHGKTLEEIFYPRENYCIERYHATPRYSSGAQYSISIQELSVNDNIKWVSGLNASTLLLTLCDSECSVSSAHDTVCIPKCCTFGKSYGITEDERLECIEVDRQWLPNVFLSRRAANPVADVYPNIHRSGFSTYIACKKLTEPIILKSEDLRILANGEIYKHAPYTNRWKVDWKLVNDEPACIEGVWESERYSNVSLVRCQLPEEEILRSEIERNETLFRLNMPKHIILPSVYIPCMLIHGTVVGVYASLWNHQNLHGWSIMAFSASEFVYYLSLTVIQSVTLYGNISTLATSICASLGAVLHFSYISCFTWTVVIAGDMWRSLSAFSLAQDRKGTKKFIAYACFAWGIPAVMVSIGCAMEWGTGEFLEGYLVDPGYSSYCTVFGNKAFLFYMGLPSVALFVTVLVLALMTFVSLWETRKKVRSIQNQKSKQESVKDTALLIVKMGTLMGFFLIFEFVMNFLDLLLIHPAFALVESYHLLQAIGLFWIYVCSKKTVNQLRKRSRTIRRILPRKEEPKTEGTTTEMVQTNA